MPELPEVEHAAALLRRTMLGRRIEHVDVFDRRILDGTAPSAFRSALEGARAREVQRHGKNLLVDFDNGRMLHGHLGMTGRFSVREANSDSPRFTRVSLVLEGRTTLYYRDARLLGRLVIASPNESTAALSGLGPDALEQDIADALRTGFERSSRSVKVVLMDQSVIAGIGNIQATEALFFAGIHPARAASSLDAQEIDAVERAIRESLKRTLASMDCDEVAYVSDRAGAPNPFALYGRKAEPCPRCGVAIESMVISGRTSAFCPRCQPTTRSAPRRAR